VEERRRVVVAAARGERVRRAARGVAGVVDDLSVNPKARKSMPRSPRRRLGEERGEELRASMLSRADIEPEQSTVIPRKRSVLFSL